MQNDSPLRKSLSRTQTFSILGGFIVLVAVAWGLLSSRRSPDAAPARAVEMSAVVAEESGGEEPDPSIGQPAPGTHQRQVQEETLQNLKHGAQTQQ